MLYLIHNTPMQTTAPPTKVATGTSTKTMMQIKPLVPMRIVEWGFSFDGAAAATPGYVELIAANVAATVTAYVAADLSALDAEAIQFNSGDPTSNYISVGTSASGYTASSEGSVTAVRNLAAVQLAAPTTEFIYQSPLGYRGYAKVGDFVRIRMTFGTTINTLCYLICEF